MQNCPKCQSEKIYKFGIVRNKQRFKCKECSFNFTTSEPRGKSDELKIKALQLYLEGLGFRSIGRILGVSQVSILNWIRRFGKNLPTATKPEKVEIMELDEIWHFVGKKNENGGFGSLFVALPKTFSDLRWVVVERKQDDNFGTK